MTVSLPMLLGAVLPILATTVLFALVLSLAMVLMPRSKADPFARQSSRTKTSVSR